MSRLSRRLPELRGFGLPVQRRKRLNGFGDESFVDVGAGQSHVGPTTQTFVDVGAGQSYVAPTTQTFVDVGASYSTQGGQIPPPEFQFMPPPPAITQFAPSPWVMPPTLVVPMLPPPPPPPMMAPVEVTPAASFIWAPPPPPPPSAELVKIPSYVPEMVIAPTLPVASVPTYVPPALPPPPPPPEPVVLHPQAIYSPPVEAPAPPQFLPTTAVELERVSDIGVDTMTAPVKAVTTAPPPASVEYPRAAPMQMPVEEPIYPHTVPLAPAPMPSTASEMAKATDNAATIEQVLTIFDSLMRAEALTPVPNSSWSEKSVASPPSAKTAAGLVAVPSMAHTIVLPQPNPNVDLRTALAVDSHGQATQAVTTPKADNNVALAVGAGILAKLLFF